MSIGSKVKSKLCPTLQGTIIKMCGNDVAVIEINDKYLTLNEMMICTDNLEVIAE